MGCTAALVALHQDGQVIVAHVGDVRVYRIVERHVSLLTADDRLIAEPGSAVISRVIGGTREVAAVPHTFPVSVRRGDRLVLCSTGFHDAVHPDLSTPGISDPDVCDAARALVRTARGSSRSGNENITVLVIDVG
jgi:serine/threonine protein phosphatase PrpC